MKGYGQFCPVAKASEVLGERWTPLIIRELLCGSTGFNDIHRGVPLMSRSLLSSRLAALQRAGVIERIESEDGVDYRLTDAGEELRPIIMQLGSWGQRWARGDMARRDLDPSLLMWDVHRRIDTSYFQEGRTVVLFEFTDYTSKMRCWWLVIKNEEVDICLKDPGFGVDLHIATDLRTFTSVWLGDATLETALREGNVTVKGTPALRRTMPEWLQLSPLAGVERPVKGRAPARGRAARR